MIKARVYPTESEDKVKKAIQNLFECLEFSEERINGEKYIICRSCDKKSLNKLYALLRSQSILDSARAIFYRSLEGNKISFKLNKQAAYAGSVNFLDSELEASPLGNIDVELSDENIKAVADWLAPQTGG